MKRCSICRKPLANPSRKTCSHECRYAAVSASRISFERGTPQNAKRRCGRCRKRFDLDALREVASKWVGSSGLILVCQECASRALRPSICSVCAGLPHRVVGAHCTRCGLARAETRA